MTTRDRIIVEINELNPTASREFLALFGERELEQYRDHLLHAIRPRGATAGWIRPAEEPAIVVRTSAA
jgi:hypothetical protein